MNDIEKNKITQEIVDSENIPIPENDLSKKEISQLDQEIQKSANTEYAMHMKTIETKIRDIDAELATLKKDIAEYDQEKKVMDAKTKKEKEDKFNKEKIAIEEKKKEIEKMLIDIKLKQLDQAQKQKITEAEEKLKKITKELDGMKTLSFWGRAWEWTKEHKKPLLIASGIGIGIWALTRLFRRRNKDKDSEDDNSDDGEEKKKNKKGFWNRGIGKVLKYVAIAGLGFLGLRWLFNKSTERTPEDPKTEVDDYNNLTPEVKEKYENFGDQINEYYEGIYDKELKSGWSYKERLGRISENVQIAEGHTKEELSGIVPFVMNKNFSSVDKILSEEGYRLQIISDDLSYYKTKILAEGEKFIEGFIFPYVSKLASFATLGLSSSDSIETKMKKWFEYGDPQERLKEIQLFFRQYMKVLSYLQDKKEQLIIKIVEDKEYKGKKISSYPEEERYELINELLQDDEWAKENLINDERYVAFMGGTLYSVIDVLKENNLFDSKCSAQIQAGIDTLDEERDELLEYDEGTSKDVLQRGQEDIEDGKIDNKQELLDVCDRFNEHIDDNFEETLCGFMGIFNPIYEEVFDKREDLKQQFLSHIGADAMKYQFKKDINEFKKKIENGTMSKEDYKIFSDKINGFLVFKKELFLATETMYSISMQNGSLVVQITDKFKAVRNTFTNRCGYGWDKMINGKNRATNILGFWMLSGPLALGSYLLSSNKYVGKIMKPISNVSGHIFAAPYHLSRYAQARGGRLVAGRYRGGPKVLYKRVFFGTGGYNRFQNAMKNGNLTGGQVRGLINNTDVRKAWNVSKVDSVVADAFGLSDQGLTRTASNRAYDLLKAMDQNSIRKLLKKGNIDGNNLADAFRSYIDKMDKGGLSTNKKALMEKILKYGDFSNVDDISKVVNNIDNINLEGLSPDQIKKLAKELGEDVNLDNVTKVNAKINKIKKAASAADEVVDLLDDVSVKKINDLIDVDLKKTKSILKNMNATKNRPNSSKIRRKYYQNIVESLEIFKLNTKKMTKGEFDAILKFTSHGFEVGDIAKLYKLKAVQGLEGIEDIIKRGDITELTRFLDEAAVDVKYAKYMVDIKVLSTKLDVLGKNALKAGDDIAELLTKNMIKLFTKFS